MRKIKNALRKEWLASPLRGEIETKQNALEAYSAMADIAFRAIEALSEAAPPAADARDAMEHLLRLLDEEDTMDRTKMNRAMLSDFYDDLREARKDARAAMSAASQDREKG